MKFAQNIINDWNGFSHPLKVRLFASFLQKLITEGMIPFVTIFLVLKEGEFLTGIIALSILVFGVFFNGYGGIKANNGLIKQTLIIGELFQFIIIFLMAFFIDNIVSVFIVLYLLKSLIFSYLLPFNEVLVFELTNTENRATVYQFSNVINGLSMPLGALLGGFFYGYGLDVLMFVLSALSFLVFFIYLFGLYSFVDSGTKNNKKEKNKSRFSVVFKDKKSLFLILSSICIHVLFFSLSQFLPAYLSKIQNGYEILSVSRSINGIVGFGAGIFLLGFIKKISNYSYIIPISVLYGVLFVIMFLMVDYQWLFYFISAIMSIFYFISAVGIKTIFANNIDADNSGIYLSAFSLTGRFGNIGASCLLAMSGFVGYNMVIILLAIFATLSIVCLLQAKSKQSQ